MVSRREIGWVDGLGGVLAGWSGSPVVPIYLLRIGLHVSWFYRLPIARRGGALINRATSAVTAGVVVSELAITIDDTTPMERIMSPTLGIIVANNLVTIVIVVWPVIAIGNTHNMPITPVQRIKVKAK
jgi:hypothetical protein